MSEVLALTVEALVPLRHKPVNGCLVKFPGLRCEAVPRVLLDVVVVRDELFGPQGLFLGEQKWRNRGREVWTVRRVTALGDYRMLLLAFSHVICTLDHLAAGSGPPSCCRKYCLLHTQRYCHRFAHSRSRFVSFLTPPARFFFNSLYLAIIIIHSHSLRAPMT